MFGKILMLVFGGVLIAVSVILMVIVSESPFRFFLVGAAVLCVFFIIFAIANSYQGNLLGMIVWFIFTGLLIGVMVILSFIGATESPLNIVFTILLIVGYVLIIFAGVRIARDEYN